MFQTDFMPVYNERGLLEKIEYVPFRLTRNLATFFTAFGVEGVFMTAMVNAAQAVLQKHSNAAHVLSLFFRDDIVAWAARRSGKQGGAPGGGGRGGVRGGGHRPRLGKGTGWALGWEGRGGAAAFVLSL